MIGSRASWQRGAHHRVILDNDWAGDPDGLIGLAHHLLSPSDRVTLITSSLIAPMFPASSTGAARGAELARQLVDLIDPAVPVVAGAESPGMHSAAADAIADELARDDELPVILVCAGPLTNVAAALRRGPTDGVRLVWVGGSIGAEFEYNAQTDPAAAAEVFALPGLIIDQFPIETYRRATYSVAELRADLASTGTVGAWLWSAFEQLAIPDDIPVGEVWSLGDSLPLLVTALGAAPSHTGVHVHHDLDLRLIIGDLLAKLRIHRHETESRS